MIGFHLDYESSFRIPYSTLDFIFIRPGLRFQTRQREWNYAWRDLEYRSCSSALSTQWGRRGVPDSWGTLVRWEKGDGIRPSYSKAKQNIRFENILPNTTSFLLFHYFLPTIWTGDWAEVIKLTALLRSNEDWTASAAMAAIRACERRTQLLSGVRSFCSNDFKAFLWMLVITYLDPYERHSMLFWKLLVAVCFYLMLEDVHLYSNQKESSKEFVMLVLVLPREQALGNSIVLVVLELVIIAWVQPREPAREGHPRSFSTWVHRAVVL